MKPSLIPAQVEEHDLEKAICGDLDGLISDLDVESLADQATLYDGPDYGVWEMRQTFLEICRHALMSIVRYMKAINLGFLSHDLIDVMELIISPLVDKAEQVGVKLETIRLVAFQRALQEIQTSQVSLSHDRIAPLNAIFDAVRDTLKLDMRGHVVAVANLLAFYQKLKQDPDVTPEEIRKVFAIGIPSLTMIRKSTLEDLSSLSGIPVKRMSAIRNIAREFQLSWLLKTSVHALTHGAIENASDLTPEVVPSRI